MGKKLIVIADDFGIGPATSEGIVQAFQSGALAGTVLLVNSPFAEGAVELWKKEKVEGELGWHPNLTLDCPVLPTEEVPSLVNLDGKFFSLGQFILGSFLGKINRVEVYKELRAQLERFRCLTGYYPDVVNTHQHIAILSSVGIALVEIFNELNWRPYFRRIVEPWSLVIKSGGARLKRAFLVRSGYRNAKLLKKYGFPGPDCLLGVCDYRQAGIPSFIKERLGFANSHCVEWMSHPGLPDPTLEGRDGPKDNPAIAMRARELRYFCTGEFKETAQDLGYCLINPRELKKLVA